MYLHPARKHFRIEWYTEEGEWDTLARVEQSENFDKALKIVKNAYERKET